MPRRRRGGGRGSNRRACRWRLARRASTTMDIKINAASARDMNRAQHRAWRESRRSTLSRIAVCASAVRRRCGSSGSPPSCMLGGNICRCATDSVIERYERMTSPLRSMGAVRRRTAARQANDAGICRKINKSAVAATASGDGESDNVGRRKIASSSVAKISSENNIGKCMVRIVTVALGSISIAAWWVCRSANIARRQTSRDQCSVGASTANGSDNIAQRFI